MQTQTPEQNSVAEPRKRQNTGLTPTEQNVEGEAPAQSTTGSTLIEFPGTGRNRPVWRKELSERVREIQQRRAREAALEIPEGAQLQGGLASETALYADGLSVKASPENNSKQLGLVPPPLDSPEPNPIVVAALRRVERARRQSTMPVPRAGAGRATSAATAAARVAEEQYESPVEAVTAPARPEALKSPVAEAGNAPDAFEKKGETITSELSRVSNLVVVPSAPVVNSEAVATVTKQDVPVVKAPTLSASATGETSLSKTSTVTPTREIADPQSKPDMAAAAATTTKVQPRRIEGVIDDSWLTRLDAEILPKVASAKDLCDDHAPRTIRMLGAVADLVFVTFLSMPFAAGIELTIGNWRDPRVLASMGGIVAVIMFLYLTCSTALAGRTLGMKLFSLQAVDAVTALSPTTGQCARRAVVYMLSLAVFGLGILYALFDAEGRAAHDHLSGTIVVKS